MKLRALLLSAAAFGGCRSIPLNEDPTVPRRQAHVSHRAIYDVAWVAPLVKLGLLEYRPIEPATPAVDPETERVIAVARDGHVRALSPIDGQTEWSLKTQGRFVSGPTVFQGVVYVSGGDGVLYALRSSSGDKLWEYKANEELVSSPTIAGDLVLVSSQSETVFAVNRTTGQWVWQYRRDPPSGFAVRGAARPVVFEKSVLMGFADGHLVALDLESGVALWEKKLSLSGGNQFVDVDTTPIVVGQRVYVASYGYGVFALDGKTGDLIWSTGHTGITSLLAQGSMLFATGDGALTAFDLGSGKETWSLNLSDPVTKGKAINSGRSMTTIPGYLVVPTSTALAFVDVAGPRVVSMWNPGRGVTAAPTGFASPKDGGRMYVMSNLGTVFALQLR